MSTSTEYMDGLNASVERRFYPRVAPPTPIYVAFGSNNLGVLHNVSENGLQVKTPGGLPLNSVFRVFLSSEWRSENDYCERTHGLDRRRGKAFGNSASRSRG